MTHSGRRPARSPYVPDLPPVRDPKFPDLFLEPPPLDDDIEEDE